MKEILRENVRLEIVYGGYYAWSKTSVEQQIKDHQQLSKEIQDHMPDKLDCQVTWDSEEICSFCGFRWEEEDTGEPVCCDKAVEEWEMNKRLENAIGIKGIESVTSLTENDGDG